MIIYIPRLIESAEQAEALPIGTIAVLPDGLCHRQILTKTDNSPGPWKADMRGYPNDVLLGWTALVPVEAEEETREHAWRLDTSSTPGESYLRRNTATRLVTPWEQLGGPLGGTA